MHAIVGERFRAAFHLDMAAALLLLNLHVWGISTPVAQGAQEQCRKIGSFTVCGRFLDEWSKPGSEQSSVYVNGLPITARRPEVSLADGKSYDMQ